MRPIVRVEGLGKRYRIGRREAAYGTLRESLMGAMTAPVRGARRLLSSGRADGGSANDDRFWALRDVSFEVHPGEVVGIIGRNGAGKSTLLKVLSRITEPTEGCVKLWGRVASLLEVGTGFHPELTGRENIYLNGSILGMKRSEITKKFDEIVDFAEVEDFLDTPVKRYSSGMYVRLAFAVAAHLEPEVLIIDEVLAVGDTEFQKKCIGKMGDVASDGRTVLFVSHNLGAVRQMCTRALVLQRGEVVSDGPVSASLTAYFKNDQTANLYDDSSVRIAVRFLVGGRPSTIWPANTEGEIEVDLNSRRVLSSPAIDVSIYASSGERLMTVPSDRVSTAFTGRKLTRFRASLRLMNVGFVSPNLTVDIGLRVLASPNYLVCWRGALDVTTDLTHIDWIPVTDTLLVPLLTFALNGLEDAHEIA